ncbi:hypothetical protein [Vibrio europaeus]|uniref:hypothetical protein n=1 Tax=Vibrio europaeus TaxID=300876 RepID=UPI00233EA340|nr:hypothetical protein [Vibrio europaeus]MDC5857453.1 hypothetical protein [Vibrio europaeus]
MKKRNDTAFKSYSLKKIPDPKKWVGYFTMATVLIVSLWGRDDATLVNESIIDILICFLFALVFYLTIVSYRFFWRKSKENQMTISNEHTKENKITAFSLLMLPFLYLLFLYQLVCIVAPTLIHHITLGEEYELQVTVNKRSSSYDGTVVPRMLGEPCKGLVYITEYSYESNDSVCGLTKEDWSNIERGDVITLTGRKSFIGFSYDTYEINRQSK